MITKLEVAIHLDKQSYRVKTNTRTSAVYNSFEDLYLAYKTPNSNFLCHTIHGSTIEYKTIFSHKCSISKFFRVLQDHFPELFL